MSSPSDCFECQWRPSRRLLLLYLLLWSAALIAPWLAAIPLAAALGGSVLCLAHAAWVLPRQILLSRDGAFVGLRQDASGWHLRSRCGDWQPVQLQRDSLALPQAVVLRFRLAGERRVRGLCILPDAMEASAHRRLRVRLKFSRHRWVAAE